MTPGRLALFPSPPGSILGLGTMLGWAWCRGSSPPNLLGSTPGLGTMPPGIAPGSSLPNLLESSRLGDDAAGHAAGRLDDDIARVDRARPRLGARPAWSRGRRAAGPVHDRGRLGRGRPDHRLLGWTGRLTTALDAGFETFVGRAAIGPLAGSLTCKRAASAGLLLRGRRRRSQSQASRTVQHGALVSRRWLVLPSWSSIVSRCAARYGRCYLPRGDCDH